jgi:preprotein translocase subunit SecG
MLLFVACSKDSVEILTGDDYRYWKRKISVYNPIITYEYFDIKGRWTCFGFRDGRFKKVNTFDVVLNEHWHLEGDSILVFNYWRYNIVDISGEMIILSRNGQTDTLLAANEEEIPLKYKRRWDFSIRQPDILDRLYKNKIDFLHLHRLCVIILLLLWRDSMKTALLVVSILLIIIVLLQSAKAEGGAQIISGGQSELFANRKDRGSELVITRVTALLGVAFFVICLVSMFI